MCLVRVPKAYTVPTKEIEVGVGDERARETNASSWAVAFNGGYGPCVCICERNKRGEVINMS